jgi:hypothetical protein
MSATLPPIGQINDDDSAVKFLADLAREARDARADLVQTVEDNINVFRFGKTTGSPAEGELVVNEIQNAILAATHIQTQEPPQATLEPVETGEQPLYFWAGPQDIGIAMFGLEAFEVAEWVDELGQVQPPTPLDPMVAGMLKAAAVPEEVSPALPPGAIRPEWVLEVSDQTIADDYQILLDLFWERSDADRFIRDLLLRTSIQGWAWGLYEFDDTRLRHKLTILPILQVYIDPTVRDISDAAYAGFDLPLWADEAKTLYPELADAIEADAFVGRPQFVDQNTEYSSTYDRVFQRPMVTFRCFWLRNQQVPMTKDEAVALGLVEEVVEPLPQFVDGTTPNVESGNEPEPGSTPSDGGVHSSAGVEGYEAAGTAFGGGGGASLPSDSGESLQATAGQTDGRDGTSASTSASCILVATGEVVSPGDTNWPTRIGIRQLVQVGGRIVDDRECEHFDIPILHNVNIPFPTECPWGQGEPERLKGQQAALTRVVNAMVTHGDFHAAPLVTMSKSMYDSLPPQFKEGRVKPGMLIVVPDDQYMALGGKVETIHDPAPLSPAHVELIPMLRQFLADNSGHSDVMQGRTNPGDSGKKVELLQASGSGVAGYKAKRSGDTVRRMTHLMLHSIIWRLDVKDIARIISKPPHVLEIIHGRAREIEWNVKVVIQAGAGLQIQKRQLALMDLQSQLISRQTAQEESGRDPRLEEQRMMIEAAKLAAVGMAPGQEEGGGPEKKEKKPSA